MTPSFPTRRSSDLCIYGSATMDGDRLAWPMKARNSKRNGAIFDPALLPTQMDVEFVPFLGMLVHREMIARIGVPDASFFIAKDDVEYCYRARRAGARIELLAASRIEPRAAQHPDFSLPGISR